MQRCYEAEAFHSKRLHEAERGRAPMHFASSIEDAAVRECGESARRMSASSSGRDARRLRHANTTYSIEKRQGCLSPSPAARAKARGRYFGYCGRCARQQGKSGPQRAIT